MTFVFIEITYRVIATLGSGGWQNTPLSFAAHLLTKANSSTRTHHSESKIDIMYVKFIPKSTKFYDRKQQSL